MFDKLRIHHFRLIIPLLAGLAFACGAVLMYLNYKEVEWAEASRLGTQNQALARAGAKAINEFLEARKIELLLLAKDEAIREGDLEMSRSKMELLYSKIGSKGIAGIARISREGRFLYGIPLKGWQEEDVVDVSDRDYFAWTQDPENQGKIYVSLPILARSSSYRGKMMTTIVTPVYWQERFNGLVMFAFLPDKLAETYLLPLHPYAGGNVLLIDQGGALIVCTREAEMVGKNIIEYLKNLDNPQYKSLLFLLNEMSRGKEGWVVTDFVFPEKDYGKEIVGFASVEFGQHFWSVGSTVAYNEALSRISKFSSRQAWFIIFVLLAALTISAGLILGVRVAQRDAFLDGFRNGQGSLKGRRKTKTKKK